MEEKSIGHIGLLVRSYEALRNWRALLMLGFGVLAGMGLMALATLTGAKFGFIPALVVMLLAALVYLAGINAAGLLLVDQADSRPDRSFAAAFFGGMGATITSIVAMLMLSVGLLGVFALIYLVSLLGRVPGVGSVFTFLFAGPSAVVLAFCYGVLVIGTPLMWAAIWRGETAVSALGRIIDIVVKRPLDALLHVLLLFLIVAPVAMFVMGLMAATSGLSLSLYSHSFGNYGGYYGDPLQAFASSMAESFQQLGAASASISLVMALLVAMFCMVVLLGYVMVYDSLITGLQPSAGVRIKNDFDRLKQKVNEHRPRQVAQSTLRHCASCGSLQNEGDRFCGECGATAST